MRSGIRYSCDGLTEGWGHIELRTFFPNHEHTDFAKLVLIGRLPGPGRTTKQKLCYGKLENHCNFFSIFGNEQTAVRVRALITQRSPVNIGMAFVAAASLSFRWVGKKCFDSIKLLLNYNAVADVRSRYTQYIH